jgi:hypothetical protein
VGADVHFESKRNRFGLVQKYELPKTQPKALSLFLSEIGNSIVSRRKTITKEERERIVRVVRALVQ